MIAQRYTISDVNTMVTFGNGDVAISGKVAKSALMGKKEISVLLILLK